MECDCKPESVCTSTSSCGTTDPVASAVWVDYNNVLTGALAVLGFVLYRLTQALPALIRWPVRLVCSLTGVSSMWSWLSRIVNTVLGLQTTFKWLCRLWKVAVGSLSNIKKCTKFVTKMIRELRDIYNDQYTQERYFQNPTPMTPYLSDPELRVILVGPCVASLRLVRDTLLGCHYFHGRRTTVHHGRCEGQRAVVEGRPVTVVTTPDILGSSLGPGEMAQEALRSLQLASPGPHAFLLVLQASVTSDTSGGMTALRNLQELLGEGALGHLLLVLTHTDFPRDPSPSNHLLEGPSEGRGIPLSLWSQKAELLDIRPTCPLAQRKAQSRWLLERVAEMRARSGHYLHELQRKEDRMRQQLLTDMAAELQRRLEERERERLEEDWE